MAVMSDFWTFVTPNSSIIAGIDSGFGHGILTRSFFWHHNGGGSGNNYVERTFTGLTPSVWHTVKCWMYLVGRPWFDVDTGITVVGGTDGGPNPADASDAQWSEVVARGVSNASGELTVRLFRRRGFPIGYNLKGWFSGLRIYEGEDC